jgi:oligopeptide transport system permease protein
MLGLAGGTLAVAFRGHWLEHLSVGLCLVGISLPTFVIGAVLLIVVALWLRAVPVGGWGSPAQAILPAITLALPYAAYIARLTRAALLDAYAEDYIRTARAKGLSAARVLLDHALRNALLPVLSYLGPAAAAIFTGSFVVEKVFTIPGMGTHVVESINNRDQSLILATVMVYALLLASFNLIVDLLYGVIDPRIRVGARQP